MQLHSHYLDITCSLIKCPLHTNWSRLVSNNSPLSMPIVICTSWKIHQGYGEVFGGCSTYNPIVLVQEHTSPDATVVLGRTLPPYSTPCRSIDTHQIGTNGKE